jgi:hypothetical protein
MTLTIDLTPEQSARLEQEAKARGVDVPAVLRDLIEQMPNRRPVLEKKTREELSPMPKDKPDYSRLRGYGKFAGLGPSVDEFLREKHAETAREEHGL